MNWDEYLEAHGQSNAEADQDDCDEEQLSFFAFSVGRVTSFFVNKCNSLSSSKRKYFCLIIFISYFISYEILNDTYISVVAVIIASIPTKQESNPKSRTMKKKHTAQNCGQGMRATARGYAMKAKPGPDSATSAIGRPRSWAMKPRMEKMANPDTKDVPK